MGMRQGVLDQPLFTIWMDNNISREVVGELTFGGINPKYFNGALVQIPTNNPVRSLPLCHIGDQFLPTVDVDAGLYLVGGS